jgi:hypothetical protein
MLLAYQLEKRFFSSSIVVDHSGFPIFSAKQTTFEEYHILCLLKALSLRSVKRKCYLLAQDSIENLSYGFLITVVQCIAETALRAFSQAIEKSYGTKEEQPLH